MGSEVKDKSVPKAETKMQEMKPEPYWPAILTATVLLGILWFLIYTYTPLGGWVSLPFLAFLWVWSIWMSRFAASNCIQAQKVSIFKDRIEATSKNGKQYQLSYDKVKKIKLVWLPARYGAEVSYISLKTTIGNIRLNVLGERIKDGYFWERGRYESRNYGAYYRLKKAFQKYKGVSPQ